MAIHDALLHTIERADRRAAPRLLKSGGVQLVAGSKSEVAGRIGPRSAPERTRVRRQGDLLLAECSCQAAAPVRVCLHVWALLLLAEREGHLEAPRPARGVRLVAGGSPAEWRARFHDLSARLSGEAPPGQGGSPEPRRLVYVFDRDLTLRGPGLALRIGMTRAVPGPRLGVDLRLAESAAGPADREVVGILKGPRSLRDAWSTSFAHVRRNELGEPVYYLTTDLLATLVPLICRTGRAYLQLDAKTAALEPLAWEDAAPWEPRLAVQSADTGGYRLSGWLQRGAERLELDRPRLLVAGGLVFLGGRIARLEDHGAFPWIATLRERAAIEVPAEEAAELLESLDALPRLPPCELPEELRYALVRPRPRPRLTVRAGSGDDPGLLRAALSFDYDGVRVGCFEVGGVRRDRERRLAIQRDEQAERQARQRLHDLGVRPSRGAGAGAALEMGARLLPPAAAALLAEGWVVEAEGRLYRRPGKFELRVSSGIDWFELHGDIQFDGVSASLPRLLAAVRKGSNTVLLDDGTLGVLPEEWLRRYGLVAAAASEEGEALRFTRSQAGLLDALLAALPGASFDAGFARLREQLRGFEGVAPAQPGPGFQGSLRDYQAEGLGWLRFLERFGFGGCLADDMGLGKTVQVLALLEGRRAGPSLVVAPRSLIHHWAQEAARFVPALRVLDHTGAERELPADLAARFDLVLTTYGTLRRDVLSLREVEFDHAILDEAQAIKNAATETAKAVRLLRARHRLALSGTPIENHLGELWSLFEFLNPGMLGQAAVFQRLVAGEAALDAEGRALLARALRPFLLRRTKEQVAKELPARVEETLHCEMRPAQRKLYEEMRDHYRAALLGLIDQQGLERSKLNVLEALLRLRQAACHPGLLDPERRGESSAKLEALIPELVEVSQGGHKALVFSQFTRFLAIVRERLDAEGLRYEVLDGRTRDRKSRIDRFQGDPGCRVFLISLKAGGVGLNLTAADYVFLLDPWWNPAVEAQAVDRAHRIGQTRTVFAYRLIARDTVEERVLELQSRKRELADAILGSGGGMLRGLEREDLELLLS